MSHSIGRQAKVNICLLSGWLLKVSSMGTRTVYVDEGVKLTAWFSRLEGGMRGSTSHSIGGHLRRGSQCVYLYAQALVEGGSTSHRMGGRLGG